MTPRFTISVVAFGGLAHVRRCVESIIAAGMDNAELILTDNGSTDGVGEFFDAVARTHAHVNVFHNRTNLGFSLPHRRALEWARGEFFVLLNSDVEVPAGWLEVLAAPFKDNPKAALSGPVGGCNALTPSFHGTGGATTEYIEGAVLCCRTDIVRTFGLFAPYIHFAYGEDSDLSLRMREKGYTIHEVTLNYSHVRAATSARVPGIQEIQAANHAVLRRRWAHYLRVRRFGYPIVIRRKGGAWGDTLLITPILRALRFESPLSPIYVEAAPCDEVLLGNPCLTPGRCTDQSAHVIELTGAYECRPGMHIIDAYALAAGVSAYDHKTELHVSAADEAWVPSWLKDYGEDKCVAVHMGPSHWPGKQWPDANWLRLIKELQADGWIVIPVGNQRDGIMAGTPDLRGVTTTGQLAAILRHCDLFVGIDSFPIHVAQAVGTPVVGLFGATLGKFILTDGSPSIAVEADASIPCAGDRHRQTSNYVHCDGACMESITVERVLAAIHQLAK